MTAPGVFYPKGADTAEERLRFYASQFPVVEVDATYYVLPNKRSAQSWAERTPKDFVFDIKAHAFTNSGLGRLRQIDIHLAPAFATEWLA